MKRRNFLKLIGLSVAAPSAVLVTGKTTHKQGIDVDKSWAWRNYTMEYKFAPTERKGLLKKFRVAFKNTKFNHPFGIPYWVGNNEKKN